MKYTANENAVHYSVCQNNNNKIKAVEIQICRRLTEVPTPSHLHNSPKNCPTTKLSKNTPQKTTSNTRQTGRTASAFI